jgi:Co/Zn/Cd efflux system component
MKIRPLPPRPVYVRKVIRRAVLGLGIIAASLYVGMCGYHYCEDLAWIDSFANASMILSGMGPVDQMKTFGGKLFAGFYALYSGLALIAIVALVMAPVFKRFLHRFHLDEHRPD